MKQLKFQITQNVALTENVYEMVLSGNTEGIKAGQFVNILIDGLYLRRPISVCDVNENELTLVYKVVGKGTEKLSKMLLGELDILTGLGNGYDLSSCGNHSVLIGGGVGIPPLYKLAKELIKKGVKVSGILGFNKKEEIFYYDEFSALGAEVFVTTVDGSFGTKGFVTTVLENLDYDYFYTCGPEPMLKAVYKTSKTGGQFSFEERMGCGFGACMGCSCKTVTGNKRICKEGPVLKKEEILWQI